MAGLNDRRQLGTDSGRLLRAARMVRRNGGNPNELINKAAEAKLGEGSAIQSSEGNIAFEEAKRRTVAGLNESRRRAVLGGDNAQNFNADLDSSALVKTDPAARQRAYDRGASLGVSREQIDQRAGVLPKPTGAAPPATGTAPPATGTTGIAPTRPTLQGPPISAKPGLIDGKAAGSVLAGMRPTETDPGNMAGITERETKDRADAITAARTESSGNPSVTRGSVIDRINKERVAGGRQPFGEDIYKDIAKIDGAASDRVAGGRALGAVATNVGQTAVTPLQKSLADAKTRFAPPPVEIQGPPSSAKPAEFQGPPASAKPATPPQGLGASLLQDAGDVFNLSRVIPQTVRGIVKGQLAREGQVIPKFGEGLEDSATAVKKASKTAGNSILSRAPGATGSYLRNRFTR